MHNNVSAFLRIIREGESSQDDSAYRMVFGGGYFDSFAEHPNKPVTIGNITSTAAGAYQFLYRTWKECATYLRLQDFSPISQDQAAIFLIKRRGAYEDILAGRIEQAILKCNKEWASLPGSPYGQPTLTMARALEVYSKYGGGGEPVSAPIEESKPEYVKEEKAMAPFIPIAINAIAAVLPEIASIFATSDAAKKNAKAAELVVNVAKEAIGAVNEQELVESIAKDPGAVAAIKKAVADNWFAITEAGGGGIEGARAADAARTGGSSSVWKSATFITGVLLLPLVYMITASITFNLGGEWDGAVRASIASSVVGLILGAMVGYYFGASRNAGIATPILTKQ